MAAPARRRRLRTTGKQRTAECASCGVKATCDALGHPGGWPFWAGADPNIECCSPSCLAAWKAAHRHVVEGENARLLERLTGGAA